MNITIEELCARLGLSPEAFAGEVGLSRPLLDFVENNTYMPYGSAHVEKFLHRDSLPEELKKLKKANAIAALLKNQMHRKQVYRAGTEGERIGGLCLAYIAHVMGRKFSDLADPTNPIQKKKTGPRRKDGDALLEKVLTTRTLHVSIVPFASKWADGKSGLVFDLVKDALAHAKPHPIMLAVKIEHDVSALSNFLRGKAGDVLIAGQKATPEFNSLEPGIPLVRVPIHLLGRTGETFEGMELGLDSSFSDAVGTFKHAFGWYEAKRLGVPADQNIGEPFPDVEAIVKKVRARQIRLAMAHRYCLANEAKKQKGVVLLPQPVAFCDCCAYVRKGDATLLNWFREIIANERKRKSSEIADFNKAHSRDFLIFYQSSSGGSSFGA